MRIETDSDYYYEVLNIYERLRTEILKNYKSLYKASLSAGKAETYLYQTDHIGSVRNLFNICRTLDLNFGYILTGKHLKFSKDTIDFKNLLDIYEKGKYKKVYSDCVRSIMCLIRKNKKKNLKLATLLYFSDLYKVCPLDLI